MLGRSVDIGSDPRDRCVVQRDAGDAKVGYLHRLMIGGQEQVLRLDVAVNDPA